jgi:plasmid stabilization system protein ParE
MAEAYWIRLTSRAISDLENIFQYIRQNSPQNAGTMVAQIIDVIDSLCSMPSRCKVVGKSRTTGSDIHAMIVHPFIVYYRVDDPQRAVFILMILHGARKQPRSFD